MSDAPSLSPSGRIIILATAFMGWLCAGVHLQITSLAMRAASADLLDRTGVMDGARFHALDKQDQAKKPMSEVDAALLKRWRGLIASWWAWYQCAFLFGAAAGGLVLGWVGDRLGRVKGMGLSILLYSAVGGSAYFAASAEQLLVQWFVASMGVGGMWPNGVALVSEAWSSLSRPFAAGLIGTAANVGLFSMSTLGSIWKVTPDHWRWVMLVAACPVVLGVFALVAVPESPRWLADRFRTKQENTAAPGMDEVFRPPLLGTTLIGIMLATVPLIGGWGSANWMVPWADAAGAAADPPNPYLKANVSQARALTGIVGSLLGGWFAAVVGRRSSYFLTSLAALFLAQWTFWFLMPTDGSFLLWVAGLGFFSGIYFGWMPLFLPELFPTRVRSTGAGVSFNFGRIVTACTIFATGLLMHLFDNSYPQIGRVTSLIFALGMLAACLAPDTSRKQLAD